MKTKLLFLSLVLLSVLTSNLAAYSPLYASHLTDVSNTYFVPGQPQQLFFPLPSVLKATVLHPVMAKIALMHTPFLQGAVLAAGTLATVLIINIVKNNHHELPGKLEASDNAIIADQATLNKLAVSAKVPASVVNDEVFKQQKELSAKRAYKNTEAFEILATLETALKTNNTAKISEQLAKMQAVLHDLAALIEASAANSKEILHNLNGLNYIATLKRI